MISRHLGLGPGARSQGGVQVPTGGDGVDGLTHQPASPGACMAGPGADPV